MGNRVHSPLNKLFLIVNLLYFSPNLMSMTMSPTEFLDRVAREKEEPFIFIQCAIKSHTVDMMLLTARRWVHADHKKK